ncbi:MAG: hypothetical protein AB7F19_06975 [Candidatus Babeliales bacterium]
MIRSFFKKSTLYVATLSLLISPALSLGEPISPNSKALCIAYNQALESGLLSVMHELEASLEYWHTVEDNPLSHAIIRGPKGWLSSNSALEDIQNHIKVLAEKQEQVATALGALSTSYLQAPQTEQGDIATSCNNFDLSESLLGNHYTRPESFDDVIISAYATQAIEQLSTFQEQYLARVSDHLKPNHFVRNWTKYVLAAGCALAAGVYAYKNQDNLQIWKNNGKAIILKFWQDHIKNPLQNTKKVLFGQKHLPVITPEAVAGSKRTFTTNLDKLLPIIKPKATEEELATLRSYILATKDSSLIVEFWDDQAKHLIWNATTNFYNGNLHFLETNASLIQLKDWQFSEFALAFKEFWEAQQLNAALIAIFPIALGLYSIKKGYDAIFHRKILSEPLQHRLIQIDKLLNKFNSGDLQLDITGTGFLRYHLSALQHYIGRIPSTKQKAFTADIEELSNPTYSVAQKLRVIDQMYRQYAFLSPLAI